MSGTGKSTVLGELGARGYRVVDLDDEGWSVEVPTGDSTGTEQLWHADRVAALLDSGADAPHVVAGCASNQGRFYDRLVAVVLLSVPVDVLRDRLATRRTNEFGKDPIELERILRDLAEVEPLLRATSTTEIDATAPVGQVADAVEALLRESRAHRRR
jgi:adenylate kinase family enzyme